MASFNPDEHTLTVCHYCQERIYEDSEDIVEINGEIAHKECAIGAGDLDEDEGDEDADG